MAQPHAARRRRWPRRSFGLTAAVTAAALVAGLLGAPAALADSAALTITDTSGRSDPVTGVPRTYTVSGTTSSPLRVYVKERATGPTPCAATANSDSGSYWDNYDQYEDRAANGAFSYSDVFSTDLNGTVMFCIWLAPDENTSVTPITQTITFRTPGGTISATVNPTTPQPSQTATLTITGTSEAPEEVFATIKPAGAPCAATYSADSGSGVLSNTDVNGNFTLMPTFSESTAGSYIACLWLADSNDDPTPVAGPQPIPFNVGTPPQVVTRQCTAAKSKRYKLTKAVTRTKRSLLHAHKRKTRRKLSKRLKSERHQLSIANRNVRLLC
jgi:hypothetical protein